MSASDNKEPAADKATLAQMVTILTTEHFTLQTARGATISDANGRSSLFLGAVSSGLVALAFVGQATQMNETFLVFGLVLFPALFFLGLFTFVRTLETAIEDFVYALGINRIRHYYTEIAPELKPYFILSTHDDIQGMLSNMSIAPSNFQIFFTSAGMVSVINSILAGTFGALLFRALTGAALLSCVAVGVVMFAIGVALHTVHQSRVWQRAVQAQKPMFPSEITG